MKTALSGLKTVSGYGKGRKESRTKNINYSLYKSDEIKIEDRKAKTCSPHLLFLFVFRRLFYERFLFHGFFYRNSTCYRRADHRIITHTDKSHHLNMSGN